MQVKKRNGSIVPFDSEFIVRAISLAAAAAGEHSDEAIRGAVDAIVEKLAALSRDIVEIETIQDTVEECLFEQKLFRTATRAALRRVRCRQKTVATHRTQRHTFQHSQKLFGLYDLLLIQCIGTGNDTNRISR